MFIFVSVMWVHMGAVAAATSLDLIYGDLVVTHIGWIPLLFGWLAVVLEAVVLIGIVVMILSINLLDRLTEED